MSEGPFFDKAWQRRRYEEDLLKQDMENAHWGPNFQRQERSSPKPAYYPRRSPKKNPTNK